MDRPLWQTLLALSAIGLVFQRAALAYGVQLAEGDDVPLAMMVAYGLQVVVGSIAAFGLCMHRRWVTKAVAGLVSTIVATVVLEISAARLPFGGALSSSAVSLIAAAALYVALRYQARTGSDPDGRVSP